MKRGEIWWASLGRPRGSEPGFRRPVVILQADEFNASKLKTVIVAAVTSNLRLAHMPGNVAITPGESGLAARSVVNVTQIIALDRSALTERIGMLPARRMNELDAGLRLVLALG